MEKVNCGGYYIDKETLKTIDGVLTNKDTVKITEVISNIAPYCHQLMIDGTIFKISQDKDKNNCITLKETESVENSFTPCMGVRFDSSVFDFDFKKQMLSLKSEIQMLSSRNKTKSVSSTLITNVTFESLDEFTIVVKDSNGKVVEPIEDNIYQLERTKLYTYKATNKNKEVVEGDITTASRQANITKTIEF